MNSITLTSPLSEYAGYQLIPRITADRERSKTTVNLLPYTISLLSGITIYIQTITVYFSLRLVKVYLDIILNFFFVLHKYIRFPYRLTARTGIYCVGLFHPII